MSKIKLEKIDSHLKKKLQNKAFRAHYERERDKVTLAQKIAELRQKLKLKQVDIARALNVSQQFISQIETAQADNLTVSTLTRIAESLGRDVLISFPKASGKHSCFKVA
jgi:DNA-binding XRE family transcriptional regulator